MIIKSPSIELITTTTTNETKIEWTKNTYESLRGFRDCFENLSVDEVLEKAKRVNDRFFEEDTRRRAR